MVNVKYERVKQTADPDTGVQDGEEIELESNREQPELHQEDSIHNHSRTSQYHHQHQNQSHHHDEYATHPSQYIVAAGGGKDHRHRMSTKQRMGAGVSSGFSNRIIMTLLLIACYFTLSIGLTFYQRNLLQHFKLPLFVVLYHLVVKLVLSAIVRSVLRCATKRPRILLDFRTSVRRILPTGLASGIDISFSNWGLELVQISL